MNPDNPPNATEVTPIAPAPIESPEPGFNFINWLIGGILALGVLAGAFWLVFYSNLLANNTLVIPLRNKYQTVYSSVGKAVAPQAFSSPVNPIYSIQAQKPLAPGTNTYTFVGTFLSLDVTNTLINLKDASGKVYVFQISSYVFTDSNSWLKIIITPNLETLSSGTLTSNTSPTTNLSNVFSSYAQISIQNGVPVTSPATLAIRWNDTRTLSELKSDFAKNPTIPLNNQAKDSTVLAKFK